MPRNRSEKETPLKRRILHGNAGWKTLVLEREADGRWKTSIKSEISLPGVTRRYFSDYAEARLHFEDHPKHFWWSESGVCAVGDHRDEPNLSASFTLEDHPDPNPIETG